MKTALFVITISLVFYVHECLSLTFAGERRTCEILHIISSSPRKTATDFFVKNCPDIDPRTIVCTSYFDKGKSFLQAAKGNAELVACMLKKMADTDHIVDSPHVCFLGNKSWSDWLLFFTENFCAELDALSIIGKELEYFKQALDIIYEKLGPSVFSDSLIASVHKRFWGIPELMYMEYQIVDVIKAYSTNKQ